MIVSEVVSNSFFFPLPIAVIARPEGVEGTKREHGNQLVSLPPWASTEDLNVNSKSLRLHRQSKLSNRS